MAELAAPPDVEALLVSTLAGVGGCKVWAYDSGPKQHAIAEQTAVQVDVRAGSKARARDRAYAARSLMLALPGGAWDAGVVHKVEVVSGPAWIPDTDGAPRYVMRAVLHYRPTRTTP